MFSREGVDTCIRWLIATIVIVITAYLTWDGYDVAQEWQAVFVMVIGYYFKDRPQTERMQASMHKEFPLPNAAQLELSAQFILALGLLIGTVIFFVTLSPLTKELRDSVSGAWIGGVTVAIAFYFKSAGGVTMDTESKHDLLRSILAIAVAVSTVLIYWVRREPSIAAKGAIAALPLQWIALAFIVITFYFKERSNGGGGGTDSVSTGVTQNAQKA